MKKVFLFDIDYTLINTDVIKERTLADICKLFNIDRDQIESAKNKYLSSLSYKNDLNPNDMLSSIGTDLNLSILELKKVYFNPDIFIDAVYPEARQLLKLIDKSNFDLGVYSEGWDFFQRFKLESTGLIKYFEEKLIFISRRKKEVDYINKIPESIIVDDSLDVVENLTKFKKITPIWINRKTLERHPRIRTIFSLTEIG